MSLRDYQYILSVAETKHFGQAAKACNVSQPTLSMQIKKFEERYNVTLFERTNKSVHLSQTGKNLLPYIKQVLNANNDLINAVDATKSADQGTYTIGAFPTLAPFMLPHIMPALSDAYPNATYYLTEDRSPDLIQHLQNHEIDAAFLATPFDEQDNFVTLPLFSEAFYVALPKSHHLARRKLLKLSDLRDERLMLLEDSHCLSGQALEACAWAGVKNTHDFRATSIETLRQMVANGLGVTLMPAMAIDFDDPKIAYIKLDKKSKAGRTISLVWRTSYPHTEFLQSLGRLISGIYRG